MSFFFLPGPSVFFDGALVLGTAIAQMIDSLKLNMFQGVRYNTVTPDRSLGLKLWP